MQFVLDGETLTTDQLYLLGDPHSTISLSDDARRKVQRSRAVIVNIIANSQIVYGINTGFGHFANYIIPPMSLVDLQKNLIMSHAVCVGPILNRRYVRMLMALRINTLAKGRSGISPGNLQVMIKAFNSNFSPKIPQQGTVGASGDLAPLSHIALALLGQGQAWDQQQQRYINSDLVLKKMKLQRLQLKQKQGLALINGTQFITSLLVDAVIKAQTILKNFFPILAMHLVLANSNLLSPDFLASMPAYHRELAILNMSPFLQGYGLAEQTQKLPSSIRDAYSMAVNLQETLKFVRKITEEQLNSATDNPLVIYSQEGLPKDGLISGGNFHGEYSAKMADILAAAVHQIGLYSQRRIAYLVNSKKSGLQPFLIKEGGINSGFMIWQCTSAALCSENKGLVQPASIDTIQTSAGQEDHVSMGGWATRKLLKLLENVSYILAIENAALSQAVTLRSIKLFGNLKTHKQEVGKRFSFLQSDRVMYKQLQELREFLFWKTQ